MSSISFKVRTTSTDPDKLITIKLRYFENGVDQIATTKIKVPLKYWNFKKQQLQKPHRGFKAGFNHKGSAEIESEMSRIKAYVLNERAKVKEIYSGWLIDVIDAYINPDGAKKKEIKNDVVKWIREYSKNCGKSYRVMRSYAALADELEEFKAGRLIYWNDINLQFHDDLVRWYEEKEMALNTIADKIKVLKYICNHAFNLDLHTNVKYKLFKKKTEESTTIYLTPSEINRIYNCKLHNHAYLEPTRDAFILACWTGSRYSDIEKINVTNVTSDKKYIKVNQQKTGKRVTIPLHPLVKSIIEKYKTDPLPLVSNQKMNEHLKLIAKAAWLRENIETVITKGGERERSVNEKWELVSTHTGRRSFASNLYKSGFNALSIMAITGHSNYSDFMRYIRITSEENAELLLNHWERMEGFEKE